MIAKLIKGSGFRGALNYIFNGNEKSSNKSAEIVSSNMAGLTPRHLSSEFSALRKLRPTLGKAVCHISLSIPSDDKKLSKQTWGEIAETFIQELGFKDCPFIAVKHNDTDHQHIHILASRIKTNGEVVSDKNDFKRSEDIIRRLENKFGLSAVLPSNQTPKKRGKRFKNEKELKMNKHQEIAKAINQAIVNAKNMNGFIDECEKRGVALKPYLDNTKVKGLSYRYQGEWYKASSIGNEYQWGPLAKQYGQDPDYIHLSVLGRLLKQENIIDNQCFMPPQKPNGTRNEKRNILEPEYLEEVWALFDDELQEAGPRKDCVVFIFKDGGRITDKGDRIYTSAMDDKKSAEVMVKIAILKGWKSVQFKGNKNFIFFAMEEALLNGLEVVPIDEEQKKILLQVQQKINQGRAQLTLEPEPDIQQASPENVDDDDVLKINIQDSKSRLLGKRALDSNLFARDNNGPSPKNTPKKGV